MTESARARRGKAVAKEVTAAAAPEPAPAAAPAPELTCVNCGKKAIYETDGIAAAKRAYCRRDLPANVTRDMLARYRA